MPSKDNKGGKGYLLRSSFSELIRFWPLLIPLLIILPGIFEFSYPSEEARFSDMAIAHYPYTLFLKKSLLGQGVVPFWSPLILSGHPFAANPLSGLWYPPGWLAIILPLPFGFNLLVLMHLLMGGIGMYLLIRAEGVTHKPALFAAIAFESLPKLYSHYGAGHLTLLYAVPWTPWLLLTANRSNGGSSKSFFQQGLIFALIILADIRWAVYAGVIWWGYFLWRHIKGLNNKNRANENESLSRSIWKKISSLSVPISKLFTQTVLALILSAPLILPLFEYTQLSTRFNLSPEEVLTYSLPPARLLGLIFPDFGGFHEWVLYPGAAISVVSIVSLLLKERSCHSKFYLLISIFALILSLGSYIPANSLIARVPVFNLLRVPSRSLFLFGIASILYSVHGIDLLMKQKVEKQEKSGIFLALSAMVSFVVVLGVGIALLTGGLPLNFVWGCVAILVMSVWVFLFLSHLIPAQVWFLGLIGLGFIDWGVINWHSYEPRPKEEVLSERSAIAVYFSEKEGRFRIYSPSYSVPQHIASYYDLELADGVDPLQLGAYADYMEAATGVPKKGYSVTIPSYDGGDPWYDNAQYQPDSKMLGLLNVRFVVSEFDLMTDELIHINDIGEIRIYENPHYHHRAWIQASSKVLGEGAVPVEAIDWSPNKIKIIARGPGHLVLSELVYPGWQVNVDGERAELINNKNLLRGVELEDGEHKVIFSYRPSSVYLGLGIMFSGVFFYLFKLVRIKVSQS